MDLCGQEVKADLSKLYTIQTRQSSCGKPQEAYHIRCNLSKSDLSSRGRGEVPHPVLAVGISSCPGQGVPHSILSLARGYPLCGNGVHPCLGLGYTLAWDWGTPRRDLGLPGTGVPPIWDWGTPRRNLGQVTGYTTPQKGHGTSGSIMGWKWDIYSQVWTDKLKTLSSQPSDAGGNNTM